MKKNLNLEKCKSSNKGITLIALVITIIVLLILAGVTISQLTGSDSAPAKANEAKQKNDIGAAKDEVAIAVQNAQTYAYERVYVDGKHVETDEAVTKGGASNEVGTYVIKTVKAKYDAKSKVGLATVVIGADGKVTITTTDWKQEGQIATNGGVLSWKTLVANIEDVEQQGGEPEEIAENPWGGYATEDEVDYNLFRYEYYENGTKINPNTAEIDGVQQLGQVADNSGNIKIAENEPVRTAKIVGFNLDYLFSSENGFNYGINYSTRNCTGNDFGDLDSSDGEINDVYLEQLRKMTNNKLVLPATVKKNNHKYTVTDFAVNYEDTYQGASLEYAISFYYLVTRNR